MRKTTGLCAVLTLMLFLLTGCGGIGDKALTMSAIYGVTAILAIVILTGYLCLCRKKNPWLLLLLVSVAITNTGYWTLSTAETLNAALAANRLAYFGSVFLPPSMLLMILGAVDRPCGKRLPTLLAGISLVVFLVAASPGYLTIYYAEVSLAQINGASVLNKVYGPWHGVYLFYLLAYFAVTVGTVISAVAHGKLHSAVHAVMLALAVFVNIGVWLLEQLVKIDFELLSVSYILSELFLLGLDLMLWEQRRLMQPVASPAPEPLSKPQAAPETSPADESAAESAADHAAYFVAHLPTLTPAERHVYELYLSGKSSKEVMETLGIKENTLKYHNRNIYSKLGVSSRKQMLTLAAGLRLREGERADMP